jgi:hypothetical protein
VPPKNAIPRTVTQIANNGRRVLYLAVKKKWFDQIAAGTKTDELRLRTPHWEKRLMGRTYDAIEITLGYPSGDDMSRRLRFAWNGFFVCSVVHEEFGDKPVTIFRIPLLKTITVSKENTHAH